MISTGLLLQATGLLLQAHILWRVLFRRRQRLFSGMQCLLSRYVVHKMRLRTGFCRIAKADACRAASKSLALMTAVVGAHSKLAGMELESEGSS